jgi:hypothetical protein
MSLVERRHQTNDLARWFRHLLASAGGFTLNRHETAAIRDGFAVCADPTLTLTFALRDWDDGRVAAWVGVADDRARAPMAAADLHLGGWLEAATGQVWLDLVQVFPADDRQRAVALARAHQQRAVFDLSQGEVVPVAPPASGPGPAR